MLGKKWLYFCLYARCVRAARAFSTTAPLEGIPRRRHRQGGARCRGFEMLLPARRTQTGNRVRRSSPISASEGRGAGAALHQCALTTWRRRWSRPCSPVVGASHPARLREGPTAHGQADRAISTPDAAAPSASRGGDYAIRATVQCRAEDARAASSSRRPRRWRRPPRHPPAGGAAELERGEAGEAECSRPRRPAAGRRIRRAGAESPRRFRERTCSRNAGRLRRRRRR
jgi:hypothetical protein